MNRIFLHIVFYCINVWFLESFNCVGLVSSLLVSFIGLLLANFRNWYLSLRSFSSLAAKRYPFFNGCLFTRKDYLHKDLDTTTKFKQDYR